MSFRIVIDSGADIHEALASNNNIITVPYTISVGHDRAYDDGSINLNMLIERIETASKPPKSIPPRVNDYLEVYDCGADNIYVITASRALSNSYRNAQAAAEHYLKRNPDKRIHVFDSKCASSGETLVAYHILECENIGMSFKKTIEKVNEFISSRRVCFAPESSDIIKSYGFLRGLRTDMDISMRMKPVLSLKDGSVVRISSAFNSNKAISKMAAYISDELNDGEQRILTISHCDALSRAKQLRDEIMSRVLVKDTILVDMSCTCSVYLRRGAIAASL